MIYRYIRRREPSAGFPLFEQESLRYPGASSALACTSGPTLHVLVWSDSVDLIAGRAFRTLHASGSGIPSVPVVRPPCVSRSAAPSIPLLRCEWPVGGFRCEPNAGCCCRRFRRVRRRESKGAHLLSDGQGLQGSSVSGHTSTTL